MKIVDRGSQPVSNAEVLAHVTTLEAQYEKDKRSNDIPSDLKAVIRDIHTYFDRPTQPTTRPIQRAHFTPVAITALTGKLAAAPYKVLQSELLQILNHVPRDVTELSMLVEDADQRFDEQMLEEMVQLIKATLKME